MRFSGLSVPCCLAETDLVGYGAGVAQLAERLICNQLVAGSIPAAGSTILMRTKHMRMVTPSEVEGPPHDR